MVNLMQQAEAIRELRKNRAIQLFYEQVATTILADVITTTWKRISGERLDETDAVHLAQVAMEQLPDPAWIAIGSWFRSRDGDPRDEEIHEADAEILVYRLVDMGYLQ
ncbi:hypothetical protein OO015_00420 [Thermomicrobium sp. 4228-Ro]|uniref:hypothetical protein n=1 Tax=Thermomicrobium sp. 4228-Ro TaxID=2993937 RepID=UPI00224948C6|nr:hypothetical protein [Thermomicrobium sp. 4228-Ro]MCX2725971.1 hypothetical protein [Thermomicrobium sp. 4228-Ro]